MNQELTQQRTDVGKLAQQASDALQLLRVLNEQQQVDAVRLSQMTTKLDAVKTATRARAARASRWAPTTKDIPEGRLESKKTAVEKAMEQQIGLGSRPAAPLAAKSSPAAPVNAQPTAGANLTAAPVAGDVSGAAGAALGNGAAENVLPPPAAVSATTPASGATPDSVTAAESQKKVEDELSPLQRSSMEKQEAKPKQTWKEWAREKLFGKSPVRTAAKNAPPTAAPAEKR